MEPDWRIWPITGLDASDARDAQLRTPGRNDDVEQQEGAAGTGQEMRRFLLIGFKC